MSFFNVSCYISLHIVALFSLKAGVVDDKKILENLEAEGHIIFTPSRTINGRTISSYDDRYIVQYAALKKGVVVSNDNYRDLAKEDRNMARTIEWNLLQFNFIGNMLIFPDDPLGRNGPNLRQFLSF